MRRLRQNFLGNRSTLFRDCCPFYHESLLLLPLLPPVIGSGKIRHWELRVAFSFEKSASHVQNFAGNVVVMLVVMHCATTILHSFAYDIPLTIRDVCLKNQREKLLGKVVNFYTIILSTK